MIEYHRKQLTILMQSLVTARLKESLTFMVGERTESEVWFEVSKALDTAIHHHKIELTRIGGDNAVIPAMPETTGMTIPKAIDYHEAQLTILRASLEYALEQEEQTFKFGHHTASAAWYDISQALETAIHWHQLEVKCSHDPDISLLIVESKGNIAPHENNEITLILNGAKQFAVIEKRKNLASYHAAGAITRDDITVLYQDATDGAEVILTTKRKLIAEYNELLSNGVRRLGIKNYHRAMGKLFGYSKKDIEKFIADDMNCSCGKCAPLTDPDDDGFTCWNCGGIFSMNDFYSTVNLESFCGHCLSKHDGKRRYLDSGLLMPEGS